MPAAPPIVAFPNLKGGCGKSTAVLIVASAAARQGRRVLVIDVDPQGNATTALMPGGPQGTGSYGVMADHRLEGAGRRLAEVIEPAGPGWEGVDVIPGIADLSAVDSDIAPEQAYRLRKALRDGADMLAAAYDVVLVDCPPSVGRILLAALIASTHYVIVTEPVMPSLEGMGRVEDLAQVVRDITERDSPSLLGVLVGRWRPTSERHARLAEIHAAYGEAVLVGVVPERAAVPDAYTQARPIHALPGPGALAVSTIADGLWHQLDRRLHLPVAARSGSSA